MKTEISRDSHQAEKRYSGVYQQQGRMLTDADWNELVEILKQRLNNALKDVVGSKAGGIGGTPRHRALKIIEDASDIFRIQPGYVYVDGISAQLLGDVDILYSEQEDFLEPPALPDPVAGYILYADTWERTVTHLMDERLRDKGLHGADTCTRTQVLNQIKWSLFADDPEQTAKNPSKGDAQLSITLLEKTTQPDPCDPCVSQLDVASKIGNYLFRVEVHNVKGDADNPEEITLKWSSENGAEQFVALTNKEEMPDGFISDKWVYEFFDETSEKQLGVHLDDTWEPIRGVLTSPYTFHTVPDSNETQTFVRRWDGYCTLNLLDNELLEGVDRGITLGTADDGKTPGTLGYVSIGASLEVILSALQLDLQLAGRKFVAGDYWLADVREAEHETDSILIDQNTPIGIDHHYLILGTVSGGVLNENPEADRKYAFPPLTEMTRMFQVGGDGQEAMPSHILPEPIEVGVANGEWLVEGVTVRFSLEQGQDGALSESEVFAALTLPADVETGADGIARCYWQLGDGIIPHDKEQRVKAELIDRDGNPLQHPALYFNANLSTADQVAYDNPVCPVDPDDIPSVNSLLEGELVDAWPDFDGDGDSTVKDVLDVLLCKLKARHIPFDPTVKQGRWEDVNFEEEGSDSHPFTVQDAIDDLVDNLQSEDIKYPLPGCGLATNTFKDYIQAYIAHETGDASDRFRIKALWDALLCHLDAAKIPYDPANEASRWADIVENRPLQTAWVKRFGGSGADDLRALAVDSNGNVVLTGSFSDTISFNEITHSSEGDTDIYLARLNPDGDRIWSTRLGSTATDSGTAVMVDASDNIIVVAGFHGVIELGGDCDPFESLGSSDILIAKIRESDNSCDWAQAYGGDAIDLGYSVALCPDGNIVIAGFFSGQLIFGETILETEVGTDIFIAKLDASDNGTPIWAYQYGSDGYDVAYNVAVDAREQIVLTGHFQDTVSFGESVPTLESKGKSDIFVAKFDPEGECFWANQYGAERSDYGRGLALDADGSIYLTGYFQQQITFGDESDTLTSADGYDIYMAKLARSGKHIWSRTFPGTSSDQGHAISVTADGTVVLAGYFSGQVNFGGHDLLSHGGTDGFLAFFNPGGTHLHSETIGAADSDQATRLATGPANSLVLGGTFRGTAEIAGETRTSAGGSDAFVASFIPPTNGPLTVQTAIDTLISELESSDIGYQIPPCTNAVDSIRKRLPSIKNLPDMANSSMLEMFNALMCELDASTIPYDTSSDDGSLSDVFLNKEGAQTITGPLTIDDGAATPPTEKLLDVKGTIETQGFKLTTGPQLEGHVLTYDESSGMGVWDIPSAEGWNISGTNIYADILGSQEVNVGIGNNAPEARLDISGDVRLSGDGPDTRIFGISEASYDALEVRLNNDRCLRFESKPSPNILAGSKYNSIASDAQGAIVCGGGEEGYINTITGEFGVVSGGKDNDAAYYSAIGGGWANSITEWAGSIAGGYSNLVTHTCGAIGGGVNNVVEGAFATIPGGVVNRAIGDYSFAAGTWAGAEHKGTFVWADSSGSGTHWSSTANNQFLIRASGGVGIGTNSPETALVVSKENVALTGNYIQDAAIYSDRGIHVAGSHVTFTSSSSGFGPLVESAEYLGSLTLGVSKIGSLRSPFFSSSIEYLYSEDPLIIDTIWVETLTEFSDEREKKEIKTINKAMDAIKELRGVTFQWKNEKTSGNEHFGFIAQEIQKAFPDVVSEGPGGMLGVQYSKIVPVLTEALKEQDEKILSMEKRIEELEARMNNLL